MQNPEYIKLTKDYTFRKRKRFSIKVGYISMLIGISTVLYFIIK